MHGSRWLWLATMLWLLASCGEARPPVRLRLDGAAATPHSVAIVTGVVEGCPRIRVRIGEDEPSFAMSHGATWYLTLDFDGAVAAGDLEEAADGTAIRDKAVEALVTSLADAGVTAVDTELLGDAAFLLRVGPGAPNAGRALRDGLSMLADLQGRDGSLEFLLWVRPDNALWAEPPGAFAAFLESESDLWREARDASRPYVPSRPGLRLVQRRGTEGSDPADFVVVREPVDERDRFDQRMLEDARVSFSEHGKPVVTFRVREEHRQRFGQWTERHVGLPLAIVRDGLFESAPVIQARLDDYVQIMLGSLPFAEAGRDAAMLAAVLNGWATPVLPTIEGVAIWAEPGTLEIDTPIAIAEGGRVEITVEALADDGETLAEEARDVWHDPAAPSDAWVKAAADAALWRLGRGEDR
ncbi:MAG: SecDF P1 head subdomain-containing protein [Planctomycetota bacterium]